MRLLKQTFGLVDAERFLCMVKRDTFDYTEWRRDQCNDMTIDEIHEAVAEYASLLGETEIVMHKFCRILYIKYCNYVRFMIKSRDYRRLL